MLRHNELVRHFYFGFKGNVRNYHASTHSRQIPGNSIEGQITTRTSIACSERLGRRAYEGQAPLMVGMSPLL